MVTGPHSRGATSGPVRTRWLAWAFLSLFILSIRTTANGAEPQNSTSMTLPELSVPAVVTKVRPSVVTVLTRGIPPGGSQHGAPAGSGSGVILDTNGYILTNNHLVQGVTSVVVGLSTGRLTPGRVVARDFLLDLALVRITAPDLMPAEFSRRTAFEIGESVIAIGNPLALKGGSTVTVGVISALDRSVLTPEGETLYDLLQTDAAINPGNSGGALVNLRGELVGINTAIISRSGGYQGIGFAIPVNLVKNVMEQLIEHGEVRRGTIGTVTVVALNDRLVEELRLEGKRGALVWEMRRDSPAFAGGLRPGDVVEAVNGQPTEDPSQFWRAVHNAAPGSTATFNVNRGGRRTELKIAIERESTRRRRV